MTHLGYQKEEIVGLLRQEATAVVKKEELIDAGSGM